MRFKKFAAIILMSTMIGTMSLSGCGGVNKDAVAITMTSDDKDAIEVTMGYANFAARIQQAGYDSVFASYYGDDYWTNDSYAKDGKNMQESIKDSVLESIETQYLLEKQITVWRSQRKIRQPSKKQQSSLCLTTPKQHSKKWELHRSM